LTPFRWAVLAMLALIATCALLITVWSPLRTNLQRRRRFGMIVAGLGVIAFVMEMAVIRGW